MGTVPRSLDKVFGANGIISDVFNQYFNTETGKVSKLLEKEIGVTSTFAQSLNPDNKKGVICLIEDAVKGHLEEEVKKIIAQFSFDIPDSGLNKLKGYLSDEIKNLNNDNNQFFTDLKTHFSIK